MLVYEDICSFNMAKTPAASYTSLTLPQDGEHELSLCHEQSGCAVVARENVLAQTRRNEGAARHGLHTTHKCHRIRQKQRLLEVEFLHTDVIQQQAGEDARKQSQFTTLLTASTANATTAAILTWFMSSTCT